MSNQAVTSGEGPLVPANQSMPKITICGLCLAIALTIILGSATAHLVSYSPFHYYNALSIMPAQWLPFTGLLGMIVTFVLCVWIYQKIMRS